jgi:hypothetical protein
MRSGIGNSASDPFFVSPVSAVGGEAAVSTTPYGAGAAWKFNSVAGGITDAANVTLALAPGAGKRNYITGIQFCNTSAVASEITVLDGASTVIWRGVAPASMTQTTVVPIVPAIFASVNGTMQLKMVTAGTATVVAAQGYVL